MSEKPSRDQILSEPAGERLDAWVAEFVMGMEPIQLKGGLPGCVNHYFIDTKRQYVKGSPPHFSSCITDAWTALEHFSGAHLEVRQWSSGGWDVEIGGSSLADGTPIREFTQLREWADTAPLAISRCALLAVLDEE